MADQVVTLIDNEGTNLYPVAGALKQGSVTTSTINDDAVTAAKIDFSTLSGNYSTSEQDTGYTWIDGKRIYKKTINFGALPNNNTKSVDHNISNIGMVIYFEGFGVRNDGIFFPVQFTSPVGVANSISCTSSATSVEVTTGMDRTNITECYITLYYTKNS